MNDVQDPTGADWVDEELGAPKKKRGLPRWLWGCGCGCTVLLVALAIVAIVATGRMMDPERQWPRLQESLHYDERPTDLEMEFGFKVPFQGSRQFTLVAEGGRYTAQIFDYGVGGNPEELEVMFATDPDEVPVVGGLILPEDPELGALEIQGREVRTLRYSGSRLDPLGPGIRVDLSLERRPRFVDLRVPGDEMLSDEEIDEFFAHFDVWHGG